MELSSCQAEVFYRLLERAFRDNPGSRILLIPVQRDQVKALRIALDEKYAKERHP